MAPEMRNEALSLRLSKEEMQMLKGLSAATGLSQSDVLRQALRAFWAEKQIKVPQKPKR
jgi:hypothetical protein